MNGFTDRVRLANRVYEMSHFSQLVEVRNQRRILLMKAPSGYGKSHLIDYFAQSYKEKGQGNLVILDLSDLTEGKIYLIEKLISKLDSEKFHRYEKMLDKIIGSQQISGMSNNSFVGDGNTAQVFLTTGTLSKELENGLLQRLENAFFQDLKSVRKQTILLIDAFDKAPLELQKWIENQFLGVVAENLERFRVVVAGQEVPQPKADWRLYHYCCQLSPIMEVDVWYEYMQVRQWHVDRAFVGRVVSELKGRPHDIVEFFEAHTGDICG
jgi:hypothetical protein